MNSTLQTCKTSLPWSVGAISRILSGSPICSRETLPMHRHTTAIEHPILPRAHNRTRGARKAAARCGRVSWFARRAAAAAGEGGAAPHGTETWFRNATAVARHPVSATCHMSSRCGSATLGGGPGWQRHFLHLFRFCSSCIPHPEPPLQKFTVFGAPQTHRSFLEPIVGTRGPPPRPGLHRRRAPPLLRTQAN